MAFLEKIKQIDQSLFFFFNGKHTPFWDVAMSLFTRTEIWSLFFLVLIYFMVKKYKTKSVFILFFLALCIVFSDQFSVLIKETVQRFRPSHEPAIQNMVHTVLKKGGLYGFFSSHATNTFAVAFFLSAIFRNFRFSVLIFIWAAFVSYTRIYLGLHYPGDILAGVLVGCLIGWGLSILNNFIENRFFQFRSPKLSITKLESSELNIIFSVLVFVFIMILFVVNRLQYTHFL